MTEPVTESEKLPEKPQVIKAFENRFKTNSWYIGEGIFAFSIASDWTDFFRVSFVNVNDSRLSENNLTTTEGVPLFDSNLRLFGRFITLNIWNSPCVIATGRITIPSAEHNTRNVNLYDVHILAKSGLDHY